MRRSSVARFRNDELKTLNFNPALQILKFECLRQKNDPPYSMSLIAVGNASAGRRFLPATTDISALTPLEELKNALRR